MKYRLLQACCRLPGRADQPEWLPTRCGHAHLRDRGKWPGAALAGTRRCRALLPATAPVRWLRPYRPDA